MPITPTPGDDALAAGMALVPGSGLASDLEEYDNQTRDYLANGSAFWKPGVVVPVARGGTGATSAGGAETALGFVPKSMLAPVGSAAPNAIPVFDAGNRFTCGTPQSQFQVANKGYVDSAVGAGGAYVPLAGGVDVTGSLGVLGNFYVKNSTAATSSYVIAYINGDGRLSKGASSKRFKKNIRNFRKALGSLFDPKLREFQMREATDTEYHVGLIAEELADNDATARFVVYDGDGQPEAIDSIGLLLGMVYELHERVVTLEARGA